VKLLTKYECRISHENSRLFDCEINVKSSMLTHYKRIKESGRSRDSLLPDYTLYSVLLQLCLKYSKPLLIYGEIGCGKTSFAEVR
jgi:hypothetical protein